MDSGYFIRIGRDEPSSRLDCLDSLLEGLSASSVKKFGFIRAYYAVMSDDAANELAAKGYFLEPEQEFKALYQESSGHLQ